MTELVVTVLGVVAFMVVPTAAIVDCNVVLGIDVGHGVECVTT